MPVIPIINQDTAQIWRRINEKIEEPKSQRRLILFIVCVALLLDNMLYMVIVPIIPDYLRDIGTWREHTEGGHYEYRNVSATPNVTAPSAGSRVWIGGHVIYEGEDSAVGVLFASKAIVQLFINPFSGGLIDRIGYDIPMMVGLTIMFISTAIFACGRSYSVLFLARSMQGVGSAFADTSGLAMIADRFTEESERSKALGIALAFISFGCLVAPPFGGLLYQFGGKAVPFIILSLVSLIDGVLLLFVMRPVKEALKESGEERPKGTPIWRLLMDPYISVAAGALMMSNVSLAFLEPTISLWMKDTMNVEEWQMGLIWLPAFFPHVFGVYLTVQLAAKYPHYQWLMAATGLALEGLCSFIVPFARSFWVLIIPISGICFGIAQVDTSLLPTLGYLVDVRYVSIYGSIYAIADISYSLAYAIGPIIAGGIVESIGFLALNIFIALSNLLFCPVLLRLRHIYDYKPFENEANILMADPPQKQYQTYVLQDGMNPVPIKDDVTEGQQQQTSFTVQEVPGSQQHPTSGPRNVTNPFLEDSAQINNNTGSSTTTITVTSASGYSSAAPTHPAPHSDGPLPPSARTPATGPVPNVVLPGPPQQRTVTRKQVRTRGYRSSDMERMVTSSEDEME